VHALVQELEVLRFVRGAENVRVSGVRLLHAHLVFEAALDEVLGHLRAAAEFVDELLVEPRLVHAQVRIGEQPVAVEALDVVALERAAVAPDVHVIVTHRGHEHRTCHRATQRRGVEVRLPSGADVERAALQRGKPLSHQLRAALDEPRLLRAVRHRLARDLLVVRFVGLAEVGGVREGHGALLAHPVECGAGIEAAGKGDADLFADGKTLEDVGHGCPELS